MTPLAVWAPRAQQLEITFDGHHRASLKMGADGWWHWSEALHHGQDYAFYVNGHGPFPDPRSPWQPQGVHGFSRHYDPQRFASPVPGWQAPPLASAVFYELHVGTFTPQGTFAGVIDKLPYLKELGVTHVELMPVAQFAGDRGWGYDGVNLYAPHQAYGGPEGLQQLVTACHEAGLAVILDVVYNHLGPEGNYLPQFGPYFTERYHSPWGDAVNLDGPGSHEVRRFFIDNALMWLRDYHIDGLRLDAVQALVDTSAQHLLEQLGAEVATLEASLGRHLVLLPESDLNDPRLLHPREYGGYGLHAQWSDDFHHSLHALLTGEQQGYYADFGRLEHLATALQRPYVYAGHFSIHRQRHHGRCPGKLPGWRFLAYQQNHDQVGNRAQGERTCHLLEPEQVKLAAALVLTSPYLPLLFQGEEWGSSSPFLFFTDFPEELGKAVSEGRRQEFAAFAWDPAAIPDPQALETFHRSCLNWQEQQQPRHSELLAWYRQLLRLRQQEPHLRDGHRQQLQVQYDETQGWLLLQRKSLLLGANFSPSPQSVPLAADGAGEMLLASSHEVALQADGLYLPAWGCAVVRAPQRP